MNVLNQIKELTLSFFNTIDAEVSENNGLFTIIIPKKYFNYFQKSQIQITFDEKIAEQYNCELIIPGSKTLFQIITNCNNKGSISIKSAPGGTNLAIRYYFYINFSGIKQHSQLFSITVDVVNSSIISPPENLEPILIPTNLKLPSEKITLSYEIAIRELQQKSFELKDSFVNEANSLFEHDFKLFTSKYDKQMDELDSAINEKELTSIDSEKIKKFRFDTIEKIDKIQKEKENLIDILENKHQINLDYNLVAAEILLV